MPLKIKFLNLKENNENEWYPLINAIYKDNILN